MSAIDRLREVESRAIVFAGVRLLLCEAEVRLHELALKRGPRCVEPALGENALARSETRVGERDDGSAGERDAD